MPPPLEPTVQDRAPTESVVTDYDREHLITYLRLLDAEAAGADWTEVAAVVLRLDATREPARARAAWRSHLDRAHWLRENGYHQVLRDARQN